MEGEHAQNPTLITAANNTKDAIRYLHIVNCYYLKLFRGDIWYYWRWCLRYTNLTSINKVSQKGCAWQEGFVPFVQVKEATSRCHHTLVSLFDLRSLCNETQPKMQSRKLINPFCLSLFLIFSPLWFSLLSKNFKSKYGEKHLHICVLHARNPHLSSH